MNKVIISLVSALCAASVLTGCADNSPVITPLPAINNAQVSKLSTIEKPIFNKKKLAGLETLPVNSVNEQKKKQLKLHTYFFKCYSNGASSYAATDTNEHMKMLNKGAAATGVKLDANGDGAVSFDEISKFVTSDAYVKYFRESWISFSYNKLDGNTDKKLSVDEFNLFNSKVKAPEVADFQLLEEFADYDYNSNRNIELEEYEDFFMEYLMVKYGIK